MKLRHFLLAALMIPAGANHFLNLPFYVRIMPDYLPAHEALVLLSGFFAVEIGFLLLWKRTRRWGAYGAIAYFAAVFPANVHIALHPEIFPHLPPWTTWARLPFQAVLIYWAWTCRE